MSLDQQKEMAQYDRVAELQPAGTSGGKLLQREREKASFGVDDLARCIYGEEHLERMARILDVVQNEPAFDKSKLHYEGRDGKFTMGLRKEKRLAQLILEKNWSFEDTTMAEFLIDMPSTFNLHRSMWAKTIRDQGTEEQHKLFLEPSLRYEFIGCYSQTELGHGSNVQGLETTATYIPETHEFELHSPTLTAAKWWSGGLGRAATHSAVMAQLIINGKNYGPHPFVVPLRDPKTRQTLPGRSIGDIGPKFGFNSVDNGFLLLNKVRIPHSHFLAKHSQIDRNNGNYTRPPHDKLAYGTMTYIRAGIVRSARDVIARAATIATRYCAIRRQFADKDAPTSEDQKPVETQVLNYSMVQYRLIPIIAAAYAFHYTGVAMFEQYEDNMKRMSSGDFSMLGETHCFSSALKSLSTITAAQAIEDCRRCCGGHGYSLASGMAHQYADYLPQVTWEGDSYMLTQQSARYLMKIFRQIYVHKKAGKSDEFPESSPTIDYLQAFMNAPERKANVSYTGDFTAEAYVDAFGFRSAYKVSRLVQKRDLERKTWNSLLVEMFKTSKAHAQFYLINNFAKALREDEKLKAQPAVHRMMSHVFELFAAYTMDQEASEFMFCGYLTPQQAELNRQRVDELLAYLRPQAVPLVDAFKLPDYLLSSALGRSDGEVYRALFDFALADPINHVTWDVDIHSDAVHASSRL